MLGKDELSAKQLQKYSFIYPRAKARPRLGKKQEVRIIQVYQYLSL